MHGQDGHTQRSTPEPYSRLTAAARLPHSLRSEGRPASRAIFGETVIILPLDLGSGNALAPAPCGPPAIRFSRQLARSIYTNEFAAILLSVDELFGLISPGAAPFKSALREGWLRFSARLKLDLRVAESGACWRRMIRRNVLKIAAPSCARRGKERGGVRKWRKAQRSRAGSQLCSKNRAIVFLLRMSLIGDEPKALQVVSPARGRLLFLKEVC